MPFLHRIFWLVPCVMSIYRNIYNIIIDEICPTKNENLKLKIDRPSSIIYINRSSGSIGERLLLQFRIGNGRDIIVKDTKDVNYSP